MVERREAQAVALAHVRVQHCDVRRVPHEDQRPVRGRCRAHRDAVDEQPARAVGARRDGALVPDLPRATARAKCLKREQKRAGHSKGSDNPQKTEKSRKELTLRES